MNRLAQNSMTVFIIAMMMLMAMPLVSAQGDCPPGLSGEDCDLLLESTAAMEDVNTFAIEDYTFALRFAADNQALVVESSGDGAYDEQQGVEISFAPGYLAIDADELEGDGALRLVNGVVYITDDSGQWAAIDLQQLGMGGIDQLEQLLTGEGLGDDIIAWSRDADVELGGETMAVYHMDVLVDELLTSTVVVELVSDLAIQLIDDESVTPSLASILVSTILQQFAGELEDNYTFRITRYVALDDLYLNYLAVNVDFGLSFDFLRGLAPDIDEMLPSTDVLVNLQLKTTMNRHNETFEIDAPDTYEDITDEVAESLSFLGQGQLGGTGLGETTSEGPEFQIEIGAEVEGTLSSTNTSDSYEIAGRAGETVQIVARANDPEGLLDTTVKIYDSQGNLLAENDDAIDPPEEFELGMFDSYLEFEFQEDGDYLIVVTPVFPVESDTYTLIVQ